MWVRIANHYWRVYFKRFRNHHIIYIYSLLIIYLFEEGHDKRNLKNLIVLEIGSMYKIKVVLQLKPLPYYEMSNTHAIRVTPRCTLPICAFEATAYLDWTYSYYLSTKLFAYKSVSVPTIVKLLLQSNNYFWKLKINKQNNLKYLCWLNLTYTLIKVDSTSCPTDDCIWLKCIIDDNDSDIATHKYHNARKSYLHSESHVRRSRMYTVKFQ